MTYQLNEKLTLLDPYKVIIEDCKIKLDANESFIDPGEELKKKLLEAWSNISLNRYPDNIYEDLRKAFGNYYNVEPELVIAGNGSDELLSLLIGSFLKSDDKLLLADPDFSMYSISAKVYERQVCTIERLESGDLDISSVREMISREDVKALLFSNPSSATSTVTKREKILELVDNTDALVVVDEAYMDFSNQSVLQEASNRENLIVLRTCSKALGCAGIRLGFAVSSPKLINVMNALRAPYNLNTLTEAAGRIVLSEPKYIRSAIENILANRKELYDGLKVIGFSPIIEKIYPTATNYICIKTDYAYQICMGLKERSILVRNLGESIRVTVGTKEENQAVVTAMKTIINKLEGDLKDERK